MSFNILSILGGITSALHLGVSTGEVQAKATMQETLRGFFDDLLLAAEPVIENATRMIPFGGGVLAELEHVAISALTAGVQANVTVPATSVSVTAAVSTNASAGATGGATGATGATGS